MTVDHKFQRVDWNHDGPLPSDDDDAYGLAVQPGGSGLSANDLELLTLAARAIGAEIQPIEGEQWVALYYADGAISHGWNPLRHSDDALTLAVRLKLGAVASEVWAIAGSSISDYERDPVDATRIAITRAAAEIGKAMG